MTVSLLSMEKWSLAATLDDKARGEVTRIVLLPYDAAIRRVTHEGNRLILEHAARFLRGKGIV